MLRHTLLILGTLAVSGCSQDANHLGNPLTWPVAALNSGLNNAVYNARRDRVSHYVSQNHSHLTANIATGKGPYLDQAAALAYVRPARRAELLAALVSEQALYARDPEALVVALMVHGDPRPPRTKP